MKPFIVPEMTLKANQVHGRWHNSTVSHITL